MGIGWFNDAMKKGGVDEDPVDGVAVFLWILQVCCKDSEKGDSRCGMDGLVGVWAEKTTQCLAFSVHAEQAFDR